MKVGSNLIFLFRDPDNFGSAIYEALQPNPNSSFQRSESSFELSLEAYGIKDQKACGDIVHFVDDKGNLQVSVLLMQHYNVPILACAVNEVLKSIAEENPLPSLTLILPFVVPSSKVKYEDKSSPLNNGIPVWVTQLGPETEFIESIISKAQKLPSSLQIHYESLTCLLQFVRVLKFPTALLIAQSNQHVPNRSQLGEYEVICEVGKLLASSFSLCFHEERIKLSTSKTLKVAEEPWRALYG